jgi:hypothetical protein
MPEEGKKNNDRKGYPEQPQKRASAESHLNLLLVDEQQRRRSVVVPSGSMDLRAASRTSCGGRLSKSPGLAKRGGVRGAQAVREKPPSAA